MRGRSGGDAIARTPGPDWVHVSLMECGNSLPKNPLIDVRAGGEQALQAKDSGRGTLVARERRRASTAARSPILAASCRLPPSTSPAAAPTGDADSPEANAGGDPPTDRRRTNHRTGRSLLCSGRQHLPARRHPARPASSAHVGTAAAAAARHFALAAAGSPCGR